MAKWNMGDDEAPERVERYGNRRVSRMYAQINALRNAIHSEGTPAVQAAWDAVEEHIDYAYRPAPLSHPDVIAERDAWRAKAEAGVQIPQRLRGELMQWAADEQDRWPEDTAFQRDLAEFTARIRAALVGEGEVMVGMPLGYAPKTPAKGTVRGKPDIRRIVVQFDADTFSEISARAQTENVSFAEIVRRGVEWMLMDEAAQ